MDEGKLFPQHEGHPRSQYGPKDKAVGKVNGVVHLFDSFHFLRAK